MKDSRKVMIGASVMCLGLMTVAGLLFAGGKRENENPPEILVAEQDIVMETPAPVLIVIPEPETEPVVIPVPVIPDPVIETETVVQELQPEPVKPEPPVSTPTPQPEPEKLKDPDQKPVSVDPTPVPKPTETPVDAGPQDPGDNHSPGAIFVPGFGWIEPSGIPNKTIDAPEIYMNGNKVGSM